jgi:hypothetical protein
MQDAITTTPTHAYSYYIPENKLHLSKPSRREDGAVEYTLSLRGLEVATIRTGPDRAGLYLVQEDGGLHQAADDSFKLPAARGAAKDKLRRWCEKYFSEEIAAREAHHQASFDHVSYGIWQWLTQARRSYYAGE